MSDGPRIVVSTAWTGSLTLPDDLEPWGSCAHIPRGSDWELRGIRKRLHHLTATVRLLLDARGAAAVVICTSAIEIALAALLQPILCPGVKLVAFDFLAPAEGRWQDRALRILRRYDLFFCIRTGDIETFRRRFGIRRERLRFAPFPVETPTAATSSEPIDDRQQVVYSGGTAYRDWPTLVAAIESAGAPAILSTEFPLDLTPEQAVFIDERDLFSPDEARKVVRSSAVVAVICEPTDRPSGPLVLLDALALGAAVVVTEVNGSRDYVEDERTALVVQPHDVDELARAIRRLLDDDELRRRLAEAAQATCRTRFSPACWADRVLGVTRELVGAR